MNTSASSNSLEGWELVSSEWELISSEWGGALEHASKTEWRGPIAFANIGLAGAAVRGSKWIEKHRPRLLTQFTELLQYQALKVVGLCLIEVGNLSDLLGQEDRLLFDEVIQAAFEQAGATEHGPAQIIWSEGETLSAWRKEQVVNNRSPLTNISSVDPWRTLDRLEVMGDTEHGACSLLVYNNHQPSSQERPFSSGMRRRLCRATLGDAIKHAQATEHNIGFTFAGDGNYNQLGWKRILDDVSECNLTFQDTKLLWGTDRKNGDLMVTAGIAGLDVIDQICDVENRDPHHNCMMLSWCYRARATLHGTTDSTRTWVANSTQQRQAVPFQMP